MRTLVVGDREGDLPGWLEDRHVAALRRSGFLEGGGVARSGFVRAAGRLLVALPKAYASRRAQSRLGQFADYKLDQSLLLIRVLTEARRAAVGGGYAGAEEPFVEINVSDEAGALPALEAALALRTDFLANGFYWNKDVQYRRDQFGAPVDWNRTVERHPPIIERGAVFFAHTTHRHRSRDARDFLHRLHATVVDKVLDGLGDWRTLPSFISLSSEEWEQVRADPAGVVQRLLDQTYRDRGLKLLRLMGTWLREQSTRISAGEREDLMLLVASNFEYVWERMLRDLISDSSDGVWSVPRGVWTSGDGRKKEGVQPRLDAVQTLKEADNDTKLLYDAKDKRYKLSDSGEYLRSGSNTDHYKQIIYTLLGRYKNPADRFVSVLLFPMASQSETVKLLGHHKWNALPHSEVYEAAVSYEKVAAGWLGTAAFSAEEFGRAILKDVASSESKQSS